jgi:hypothetical protein
MANEDFQKQVGTAKLFKDDRGGANLYNNPIIGIVKNNIDPLRTGKIQVYLVRMNGSNEDDPNNWTWVSYMSPFFGYTPNTGSPDSDGSYVGNKNSYGFWATPPDIGTQVMCIFINGLPELGYYIGGIPNPTLTYMVPAIGASDNVIPNQGEAKSYGGATRLPVSEYNDANDSQDNSTTPHDAPRPVHSYQAAILNKQGLIRDPDRGPISSSSQRESPSRVFGMSTPGRPIYAGGYNDSTISQAIANDGIPDKNFQVIGRIGGHTLVMDDGDLVGRDQLIRLRTAQGHMILLNDYAQTLFIIHSNGQSYIELGKEGTIDMFSTNSVNIRTQGDLNLHADRNININAAKELNISAENINMESIQNTNQFTGLAFKHFTKGDHTVKVDSKMSLYSKGDSSVKSDATAFVNGSKIHLNTGASSLVPQEVKQLPITAHTDTLYDEEKGWAPAPGKLPSIVNRAPAHSPWSNANQGVDVKVNSSAAANFPSSPSPAVKSLNETLPNANNPTTPTLISTVPNTPPLNKSIPSNASAGLVSQMAVNAAKGPSSQAVAGLAGVVNTGPQSYASIGTMGLNPTQLAEAGILKPGSDVAVNAAIANGKTIQEAMPTNLFTGKNGITNVQSLVNNTPVQTNIASNLLKKSENELKTAGVIAGTESPGQIGGLLVSGATAGVGATLAGCGLSNVPLDPGQFSNPAAKVNDIKSLVSAGNQAGQVADKATNALGGINIGNALKGVAQGAFKLVTGAWKALSANKPQNLTAIAAQNTAQTLGTTSAVAAGALSSLGSAATSVASDSNIANLAVASTNAGLTGAQAGSVVNILAGGDGGSVGTAPLPGMNAISGIPGGASSVTSFVAQNVPTIPPGTTQLSNKIKEVAGSVVNGSQGVISALGAVPDQIAAKGGLTGLTSSGLGPKDSASLMAAIQAAGGGGAVDVKTPTVGLDTFDTAGLEAQSKSLLGDDKIPPLNFDQIKVAERSPSQISEYNAAKTELTALQDESFDLRKSLADAKYNFKNGNGSQDAITTAETAYKTNLQKQEELKKKLASLSSIQLA